MNKTPMAAIVMTLAASTAQAEPQVANFGQLDALRSENYLLKLQVENLELKNKVNGGAGSVIPVGNIPGPTSTNRAARSAAASYIDRSARVQLVSGIGTQITANIAMGDGSRVVARIGAKVSGLGVVRSINANEVIVTNGKETYSVPFASESANNYPSLGVTPQPAIPGSQVPPVIPMGSN